MPGLISTSDDQARTAVEELISHITDDDIAQAQKTFKSMDSVGQQRISQTHQGRHNELMIAPKLWAGFGLVRGGAVTALVGSPENIAQRLKEYAHLGVLRPSVAGLTVEYWFRAKFFQQYRLFFRYHASSKIIVYAWVNDQDTKRAYESADDAYRVFRTMLDNGQPPDDWEHLLTSAATEALRLQRYVTEPVINR